MKNLLFENFNHLIIRVFWMVKIWPYFHNSYELFVFQFFCSKSIIFEIFTWVIIHLNFMDFPFRTLKFKNDISYSKYKFSHKFGKLCK
jgi:hypothetical protein